MTEATTVKKTTVRRVAKGTMPAAAPSVIAQAMQAAGIKSFAFDLIERAKLDLPREMMLRYLQIVGFAASAYIKIAIDNALRDVQNEHEKRFENGEDEPTWSTYQEFLTWVSGQAATDQTMLDMGLDVPDLRHTVQALMNVRMQAYEIIANAYMPSAYAVPDIREFLRNPKMRSVSPTAARKQFNAIKHRATNEDGVVDVELEKELLESWKAKSMIQRMNMLEWDKRRGQIACMFFDALKISDAGHLAVTHKGSDMVITGQSHQHVQPRGKVSDKDLDVTTTPEPSLDLPPFFQWKLLNGTVNGSKAKPGGYVRTVIDQMGDDERVSFEEHEAAIIESRPFIKACKEALAHPAMKKQADEAIARNAA